jgi:hypothetical protein
MELRGPQRELNHFPGCIAAVRGHAGVVGSEPNYGGRRPPRSYGNHVVKFKGLVNGHQRMKSVRTWRTYIEAEVDFGVRTDGCGHTNFIVERGVASQLCVRWLSHPLLFADYFPSLAHNHSILLLKN